MKKYIFTSLSPNAEKDDVLRAFKLLFKPWSWNKEEYPQKVRDWFKDYSGDKNVFLTDSGRTGLLLALQALNIGEGDEVLVQAYTCVAVPNAVLWAKAKPIFVDIEINNLNISLNDARSKISAKTKAIVVQHTFGVPADMDKIMNFAREFNLLIIEDCAHGLGAEFDGRRLGTFGDAAIFSFGRDKVVSAVFGGAVAVKTEDTALRLRKTYEYLPPVGIVWTIKQLAHPIIFWLAKKFYGLGPLGKIIIEGTKRTGMFAKAVYEEERQAEKPNFTSHKLNNALAQLAYFQLTKLPRFLDHRRRLAMLYDKELEDLQMDKQYISDKMNPGYLRYFLSVDDAERLLSYAKTQKILLGDWYGQAVAPKGVNYAKIGYQTGSCVCAEEQAKRSINLPTHIGITDNDAIEISKLIKSYYDKNTRDK
jgi:dTDP-4-amino-4,6-dideoxygalactose transaminase